MGAPQKFVYDPSSSSQKRATALAMADEMLHSDLISARKDAGMSQSDVARTLGVAQSTVAAFERYDNDPRLSTIRRYAHAVGVVIKHQVKRDDGNARCEWQSKPAAVAVQMRVQEDLQRPNWSSSVATVLRAHLEKAA